MRPRRIAAYLAAGVTIAVAARRWDGGRSRTLRAIREADLNEAVRRHPAQRFSRQDKRVLDGLDFAPDNTWETS